MGQQEPTLGEKERGPLSPSKEAQVSSQSGKAGETQRSLRCLLAPELLSEKPLENPAPGPACPTPVSGAAPSGWTAARSAFGLAS